MNAPKIDYRNIDFNHPIFTLFSKSTVDYIKLHHEYINDRYNLANSRRTCLLLSILPILDNEPQEISALFHNYNVLYDRYNIKKDK